MNCLVIIEAKQQRLDKASRCAYRLNKIFSLLAISVNIAWHLFITESIVEYHWISSILARFSTTTRNTSHCMPSDERRNLTHCSLVRTFARECSMSFDRQSKSSCWTYWLVLLICDKNPETRDRVAGRAKFATEIEHHSNQIVL
jgi:hypothetical protein